MKIALVAIGDIHTRIKGGDGSEKAKDYNIMFARKDLLFGAMIDMLQSVDEYGFIFVGDIAFAGEADEYILFEEWRREAHNRIEFGINKSPFMQVFVPGNHDCTIAAAESDYRKLMIDKVMETQGADNQWVKRTISVQDNFFEYISKEKLSLDQKIYRHERYSVQGAKISVHLMNTSWLSERRDSQGNLIVPQHLMTGQIDDADFSIAVMHHPFNWLDSSIYKATQAYTASVSDIIITGHEHVIDNRIVQSNGKLHTQFENGALQGESIQNPSEFQVIFYDTTSKTISVKKASVANEEVVIEEILSDSISKLSNRQRIKSKPKMSLYENLSSDRFDNTILPVKISELYIHVPLKELGSTSPDERKNYNDARTVIEQSGRIIVSGGHLSGKTTLVKHLARNLVDEGFLVVYIDLNSKKFESRESFAKAIDDYILTNYDISLPVAWGFTKAQKVIVIDNFKLFGMNKKKIEDFVEFIGDKFGKVCVATSEDLLDLSITSKKHGFDIFRDYTKYAIEPLGYQERQQLVESWHASLISDELGHNATNIRKSRRILDEIVSTNPFPAYPIFILSVLKNITSNGEIDQSPTLPKIYDSLVNIELVKISSSVVDYPTLVSILSRIAGKMFDDKVDEISLTDIVKVIEKYKVDTANPINVDRIVEATKLSGIFNNKGGMYEFGFKYTFYYSISRYLEDAIGDSDFTKINDMIEDIGDSMNYNILLFIIYTTRDKSILKLLIAKASQLKFPAVERIKFKTDDIDPITERFSEEEINGDEIVSRLLPSKDFLAHEIELYLNESSPIENQREEARRRDASDVNKGELGEKKVRRNSALTLKNSESDTMPKEYKDLISIRPLIGLIGQTLKSEAGRLDKDIKSAALEAIYRLSIKQINQVNANIATLVEIILEAAKEGDLVEKKYEDYAEKMNLLLRSISASFIKEAAQSCATQGLELIYKDFENHESSAIQLTNFATYLEAFPNFPRDKLNKLIPSGGINRARYAMLIRLLVIQKFQFHEVERRVKEEVLRQLGIKPTQNNLSLMSGKKPEIDPA